MKLVATVLSVLVCALAEASPQERVHCNLSVLTSADRAKDREIIPVLASALRERRDLPDGYAYRFDRKVLKPLGEWLEIVARCCQPLTYEVSLEPEPDGALWVRITGHEAKEFIGTEFEPLMAKLAVRDGRR